MFGGDKMDVFLARQPIFTGEEKVYGYEILYRTGYVNVFDGTDGDRATINVIVNTFQTFGIDTLTNRKPVFINFTEGLLTKNIPSMFPSRWLVVEILENVAINGDVINSVIKLKEKGYKIALDDFVSTKGYERMINLVDIIKVDFSKVNDMDKLLYDLGNFRGDLLAEKIETRKDFEYAKSKGFKYFQGFFFAKPEVLSSKTLVPIKANQLLLITHINKKELAFDKIGSIISRDLSLTFNLLKLVNSEVFTFNRRITSVTHALVALGEREIRKWIYLILLNEMGTEKPGELTRLSLVRARFMESLTQHTKLKRHSEDAFLIGLFSLLDVILGKPLDEILEEIKATEDIKEVLLWTTGDIGTLYRLVMSYEEGDWEKVNAYSSYLNLGHETIINSYMEALSWYNALVR